jgi:glutathione S-transferase
MTMDADPVRLFGLQRSVYTRIAQLALREKGVPYALEDVEIFGPGGVPAEHLQRHPFGRIPVLQHGSFMLYETAAISRYVDEAFAGPPLQPAQAAARARMAQVIGLLDAYAYRPMVWGVFVQRVRIPLNGGVANEAEIAASVAAAARCLAALAPLLEDSPFLAGAQLSLADLHAYPMLCYFSLAAEGRAALSRHAVLLDWLQAMGSRQAVIATRSAYEVAPAGLASAG